VDKSSPHCNNFGQKFGIFQQFCVKVREIATVLDKSRRDSYSFGQKLVRLLQFWAKVGDITTILDKSPRDCYIQTKVCHAVDESKEA
jgi:hypothetical protein